MSVSVVVAVVAVAVAVVVAGVVGVVTTDVIVVAMMILHSAQRHSAKDIQHKKKCDTTHETLSITTLRFWCHNAERHSC
jgi:hypothetical protein